MRPGGAPGALQHQHSDRAPPYQCLRNGPPRPSHPWMQDLLPSQGTTGSSQVGRGGDSLGRLHHGGQQESREQRVRHVVDANVPLKALGRQPMAHRHDACAHGGHAATLSTGHGRPTSDPCAACGAEKGGRGWVPTLRSPALSMSTCSGSFKSKKACAACATDARSSRSQRTTRTSPPLAAPLVARIRSATCGATTSQLAQHTCINAVVPSDAAAAAVTCAPASTFRTSSTTVAPRLARTRAASAPRPAVAPVMATTVPLPSHTCATCVTSPRSRSRGEASQTAPPPPVAGPPVLRNGCCTSVIVMASLPAQPWRPRQSRRGRGARRCSWAQGVAASRRASWGKASWLVAVPRLVRSVLLFPHDWGLDCHSRHHDTRQTTAGHRQQRAYRRASASCGLAAMAHPNLVLPFRGEQFRRVARTAAGKDGPFITLHASASSRGACSAARSAAGGQRPWADCERHV